MRVVVLLFLFSSMLFSIETSERLFECTQIFKERKSELLVELERIDEQKQALTTLKAATEELLKQKEQKLTLQETALEKKLQEVTRKEQNISSMLQENKAVLEKITKTKMGRMAQTFAKMKPAAAASILSDMQEGDAADILSSLKPKTVGKILTKMDAKKASNLTLLLSK